jgi:hypothetical protein
MLLRGLWQRVATNRQSDCENGQRDDQNKAAGYCRGHDVEANTSRKRSNGSVCVTVGRGDAASDSKRRFPNRRPLKDDSLVVSEVLDGAI